MIPTYWLKKENYETANIFLLGLAAFLGALELVIMAALVINRFPLDQSLQADLLPEALSLFKPEREILFYRIFIAAAVGIMATALGIFRQKLNDLEFYHSARKFVLIQTLLTFCLSFSLLRMIALGPNLQITVFFYASLILGVLFKIFWVGGRAFATPAGFLQKALNSCWTVRILDGLVIVFIPLVLFIPDLKGVVAKIFVDDTWFHIDNFIMSTGWAASKGLVPFVDINGQYGVGMPVVISSFAKGLGGFTYENVLAVMIGMAIVYFIFCYCLLRVWLRNVFLAAFGLLMVMKMQMFFLPASFAFLWKYPSHTVVRFFLDVFFFFLLWLHIKKREPVYLVLALICAGVGSFYLLDSGLYLLFSAYVYLLLVYCIPAVRGDVFCSKNGVVVAVVHFAIPVVTMLLLMGSVVKGHLWTPRFWGNLFSFNVTSLGGVGAISLKTPLAEGSFGLFWEGCALIFLYVLTILVNVGLVVAGRRDRTHLFPVVLSVYGLAILHYWIFASVALKVAPVCIPGVLVFCYWVGEISRRAREAIQQMIPPVLCGLAVLFFVTTPGVGSYPNIFNAGRISYAEEEKKVAQEVNVPDDIDLIRRLTSPKERVALISVFESYLFIAADRSPFFYEGPMLNPRRFGERDFGGSRLLLNQQLQEMINQLEEEDSPPIIFVEKRLVSGQLLKIYYQHYRFLSVMTAYLQANYVPYAQGKYLVALKRVGKMR